MSKKGKRTKRIKKISGLLFTVCFIRAFTTVVWDWILIKVSKWF